MLRRVIADDALLLRALLPLRAREVRRERQLDLLEACGEPAIERKKAVRQEPLDLGGLDALAPLDVGLRSAYTEFAASVMP